MLKTVSSITNAIGALNYKGTWNASTNSPALASGVGTKGDYYVVSVAGSTNLDGETLWGVGDWAVYNGAAWQKVEGGNTINATTVSASTSVTTPVIQATSSSGGTLKNNSGTAQLQWGSGGGSNLSLEVATNINPANAAVAISPTGTGTVTISPAGALTVNPTAASTINNTSIGITTPLEGKFTDLTTTGNTILGNASTDTLNVGNGGLIKDGSGNVLVNTSSNSGTGTILFANGTIGSSGYATKAGTGGAFGGNTFIINWTGSAQLWIDGTNIGTITIVSDYRIKRNIKTQTNPALERVMALRPVTYQMANYGNLFKAGEEVKEGFIAHEVQEVIPSGADGIKDDKTQIQSLRVDAILSVVVKAIQEQQALITNLTARLEVLEAK